MNNLNVTRFFTNIQVNNNYGIKIGYNMKEREELYIIREFGQHKLYQPPANHKPNADRLATRIKHNLDWARQQNHQKLNGRITGSFIYAHPPNYLGIDTLNFSKNDWLREMNRLKDFGIDTVIFQAALWSELQECYYPSKTFKGFKQWNVIEPMLDAANELGFTVFLGGYGSVSCWIDKLNSDIINSEIKLQLECFKELLKYKDLIDGFYFAPESTYPGHRDLSREKFLSDLYGGLFSQIRAAAPKLKIMMSPATFYYPDGRMLEMADAWNAMFEKNAPDILAPQDSIGCGVITLEHQKEAYEAWSSVCHKNNIKLWANIEIFDCFYDPENPNKMREVADSERVKAQINNASAYVEKMITWEALYYTSAHAGAAGVRLKQAIFTPVPKSDLCEHEEEWI